MSDSIDVMLGRVEEQVKSIKSTIDKWEKDGLPRCHANENEIKNNKYFTRIIVVGILALALKIVLVPNWGLIKSYEKENQDGQRVSIKDLSKNYDEGFYRGYVEGSSRQDFGSDRRKSGKK
jgi:hypothetical protein